jgi:hypothetical protein
MILTWVFSKSKQYKQLLASDYERHNENLPLAPLITMLPFECDWDLPSEASFKLYERSEFITFLNS